MQGIYFCHCMIKLKSNIVYVTIVPRTDAGNVIFYLCLKLLELIGKPTLQTGGKLWTPFLGSLYVPWGAPIR